MNIVKAKPLITLSLILSIFGCGEQFAIGTAESRHNENSSSDEESRFEDAHLELDAVHSQVTSLETIAEVKYNNSDFVSVIRCAGEFDLRSATGDILRNSSGRIQSNQRFVLQAAWENALAASGSCRLLSEMVLRKSFSDPLAPTGRYFYVFNPCREIPNRQAGVVNINCSFALASTETIDLKNNLNEEKGELVRTLAEKEAAMAAVAIQLRQKLTTALAAQKQCERNAAADAVKEARLKAVMSLLTTGIAGALGGAVAGPAAAVSAAKRTLQSITDAFGPVTKASQSSCTLLQDAENEAKRYATALENITNEISQLQRKLTDL
ncbi:hypothetical protein EBU99_01720 [bacterium]|nr:hypothetical protein [bacterium]